MGSYSRFEHNSTTLEVETCPEFWPPTLVSGPLCGVRLGRARQPQHYVFPLVLRQLRALAVSHYCNKFLG